MTKLKENSKQSFISELRSQVSLSNKLLDKIGDSNDRAVLIIEKYKIFILEHIDLAQNIGDIDYVIRMYNESKIDAVRILMHDLANTNIIVYDAEIDNLLNSFS